MKRFSAPFWLAAVLLLVGGVWASAAVTAANLTMDLQSLSGPFPSKITVLITPTGAPRTNGTALILGGTRTYTTTTNGTLTITNVAGGSTNSFYQIDAITLNATNRFFVLMPGTNCDVSTPGIIVTSTTSGAPFSWTTGTSDMRYVNVGTNSYYTNGGRVYLSGEGPGGIVIRTNLTYTSNALYAIIGSGGATMSQVTNVVQGLAVLQASGTGSNVTFTGMKVQQIGGATYMVLSQTTNATPLGSEEVLKFIGEASSVPLMVDWGDSLQAGITTPNLYANRAVITNLYVLNTLSTNEPTATMQIVADNVRSKSLKIGTATEPEQMAMSTNGTMVMKGPVTITNTLTVKNTLYVEGEASAQSIYIGAPLPKITAGAETQDDTLSVVFEGSGGANKPIWSAGYDWFSGAGIAWLSVDANQFRLPTNASVGRVWTCTNATTGAGTWSNVVASGGSGITNVNSVVSNAYSLLYSTSAVQVLTKQLSNGANVTITDNGTHLVLAASLAGGAASLGDVTNVVQSYVGANATNVDVAATGFLTNWSGAISNLAQTKQYGSYWLTNYATNAILTNLLNTGVTTNGADILQSATNFTVNATNSPQVTNWLVLRQPANAALSNVVTAGNGTGMLTNNGTGTLGWMTIPGGDAGGTNARQFGSAWLTNASTNAVFTNALASGSFGAGSTNNQVMSITNLNFGSAWGTNLTATNASFASVSATQVTVTSGQFIGNGGGLTNVQGGALLQSATNYTDAAILAAAATKGAYGALITSWNPTWTAWFNTARAYSNIAFSAGEDFDAMVTNGFYGDPSAANDASLTNVAAGWYAVSAGSSWYNEPSGNFDFAVFTNGTLCASVSWYVVNESTDREWGQSGASGVIYLPASSRIDLRAEARTDAQSNLFVIQPYLIVEQAGPTVINSTLAVATNTVWIPAGAMSAGYVGTAEGGWETPTAATYTNGTLLQDQWLFSSSSNSSVQFNTTLPGFAGWVQADLYWASTNTFNGLSNTVWQVAMSPLASGDHLTNGLIYYATNCFRLLSSNAVQIASLPAFTVTNYSDAGVLTWRVGRLGTNVWESSTNLAGATRLIGVLLKYSQTNALVPTPNLPSLVTNSVQVSAGAMAGINASTYFGGLSAATAGYWTNADVIINDQWLFSKDTNNAVLFDFRPGLGFAGQFQANLSWMTTNALNGASNVVWGIKVMPLRTNDGYGSFTYETNVTVRFWSSNTLQSAYLPIVTVTNYNPDATFKFMLYRAGTNTADTAAGAARLQACQLRFVSTNWIGGMP